MTFTTGYLGEPQKASGGEFKQNTIILGTDSFEDGLKVGRFAKLDTGRIDNMDGSVTPVIAGVVVRNITNPVEDLETIDADKFSNASIAYRGLVTVNVLAGATPAKFGIVYASNAGNASDGLAMSADTGILTGARFIEEVKSGVWLIDVAPV